MKKLESLWESLKNNGQVSKKEVKVLTLEERMLEKVKKIQTTRKPQYREVIASPIIPIERMEVKKDFVEAKVERTENWQTYEKNKGIRNKKEDLKSLREELTRIFGKGYNSQRLISLYKELKGTKYSGSIIGSILLSESWKLISLKFLDHLKSIKKKIEKKILEKLLLYSIALEENRVLLN